MKGHRFFVHLMFWWCVGSGVGSVLGLGIAAVKGTPINPWWFANMFIQPVCGAYFYRRGKELDAEEGL